MSKVDLKYLLERELWNEVLELAQYTLVTESLSANQAQAAFHAATQLGKEVEAEFWVDQCLILNAENATMWRNKGRHFQLRQEWRQALEAYEKAVAIKPDVAGFQSASAFVAFQLGLHELATERYQKALQITPNVRPHWIRLARSLIHLGRLQEAEQAYAKALALRDDLAIRSARLELLRQIRLGSCAPSNLYYDAKCGQPVDLMLWTDQTRYVGDFLTQFGLPFTPVDQSRKRKDAHVALRHDVDWSIEQALAMAEIEYSLGIQSSYYLLHPDGGITQKNYFGHIDDGHLVIDPKLFKIASSLLDMGHEVGLHNDLITLALNTRRQPDEFLEQILEEFRKNGVAITGSVAHGSRMCSEFGYINYQIFRECQKCLAVDYADRPQFLEHLEKPYIELNGHIVHKYQLTMADYGLEYEANFVPWGLYVSDSSAKWSIWDRQQNALLLDKFTVKEDVQTAIGQALQSQPSNSVIQCLVHACHWSVLSHYFPKVTPYVHKRRNEEFINKRLHATLQHLHSCPNVLLALANKKLTEYEQYYGTQEQCFGVSSGVMEFIQNVLYQFVEKSPHVLEVGCCGQGDFLNLVCQAVKKQYPHEIIKGLGVDGSATRILSCASRYPDLEWVVDELEHFLTVHDDLVEKTDGHPVRYGLVLDATSVIGIEDYHVACSYFEQVRRLMLPGSIYIHIVSRRYYEQTLRKTVYAKWPEHWLELLERYFEPVINADDNVAGLHGYYQRAYRV